MKKMIKYVFVFALISTLILPQVAYSSATEASEREIVYEEPDNTDSSNIIITDEYENNTGLLRYQNVSSISPTISISSGTANCATIVVMYNSKEGHVNISLQKSADNSNFSNVASWSDDYSSSGSHSSSGKASVTNGYYYRNETTVIVKSGTTVLETIYAQSNSVYY